MIGFRSGKLVVIGTAESRNKRAYWLCQCDCGNTHVVMGKYLRSGEVKSCGCLNRQPIGGQQHHGHATGGITTTYRTWASMLNRCHCPTSSGYHKYGARGITVCERWQRFENFLADMGERPEGMTIERIDNNRGYEPENCRWATPKEQARNTSLSRLIAFNGKTQCLTDWAKELGMAPATLHRRLNLFPLEVAMTKPNRQARR